MAGMITKTLKAELKPQDKPRKRDFRRQLKGDHAELMNNFCVEISAKWGVSGPDAFQILTEALWRAAMEHGSLEFLLEKHGLQGLDISARKYGDHLGLLRETRTWDSTGADSDDESGDSGEQKAPDTLAPEANRIAPAAASLNAEQLALLDSVREGKDILLDTPEVPVEPSAEAPISEPVLETGVEPAAAQTADSELEEEGDARNQLPMSLGDEDHQEQPQVEQPEIEAPVGNGEDEQITTQPARAKPDFKALMSREKKSD